MTRRTIAATMMTCALFFVFPGVSHAQTTTSRTTVDAAQPDTKLLERAMETMKNRQYATSRNLLETLIDNHPDSGYVPYAKLSIANAWYAEGNLKKAELEYQDFVTFFPNRAETGEAQAKIDLIQKRLKD